MEILRCPKCGHIWPYTGLSGKRCNCPVCWAYVTLKYAVVPVVWGVGRNLQPGTPTAVKLAGKAFIDLLVFNGKLALEVHIVSDDGKAIQTIRVNPALFGWSPEKQQGIVAKFRGISGEYPLGKELTGELRKLVGVVVPEAKPPQGQEDK